MAEVLDRSTLDAALLKMVQDASALADRTYKDVQDSPLCTSWLGDAAACRSTLGVVSDCSARIVTLSSKVHAIIAFQTEDIDPSRLDDIQSDVNLIASTLSSLSLYAVDVGVWAALSSETIRQFAALVAAAAKQAAIIVGEAAKAAAQGLGEGIGPLGILALLGLAWLFLAPKKVVS